MLGAGGNFKKRSREKVAAGTGVESKVAFAAVPPLSEKKEIETWRKAYSVSVEGDDLQNFAPMTSFSELESRFHISSFSLDNLLSAEWTTPTLVQSEAIPVLLAGRDLICVAPTGSGKTASFVIPMLERLQGKHVSGGARGLIVVPSRELAEQVHLVVEKLSAGSAVRSVLLNSERSAKPKKWENNGSWDVIVATPMRLLQLVNSKTLSLASIEYLVLDEADRLFESDFLAQSDALFASCTNSKLMRAMFSATMGERPERLAKAIMFAPVRIIIGGRVATLKNDLIQQQLVYVGTEGGKLVHFRSLLQEGLEPPVLIFMQNKERANELFQLLTFEKINVDMLTSDRTELQRKITVKQFRQGIVWVLITTDVLGRGVDFKGVNVVINWDMPKSVPDYVHRVGRTGRAGRPGKAITYFEERDAVMAKSVAHIIANAGGDAPKWLLETSSTQLKKKGTKKNYRTPTVDVPRDSILMQPKKKKKKNKKNKETEMKK